MTTGVFVLSTESHQEAHTGASSHSRSRWVLSLCLRSPSFLQLAADVCGLPGAAPSRRVVQPLVMTRWHPCVQKSALWPPVSLFFTYSSAHHIIAGSSLSKALKAMTITIPSRVPTVPPVPVGALLPRCAFLWRGLLSLWSLPCFVTQ